MPQPQPTTRSLDRDVIEQDRYLQSVVAEGERSLGELRYEWCVTNGLAYTAYAREVGVTEAAIRFSVQRHAQANDLPMEVSYQVRNPQGGRPRTATAPPPSRRESNVINIRPAAERTVRGEVREELPGGSVPTLRVMVAQATTMARTVRQYARPVSDERDDIITLAETCVTEMQDLIHYMRGEGRWADTPET